MVKDLGENKDYIYKDFSKGDALRHKQIFAFGKIQKNFLFFKNLLYFLRCRVISIQIKVTPFQRRRVDKVLIVFLIGTAIAHYLTNMM